MKVLLTGGTGVLSTDIANLCIEKGFDTYILNRGRTKKNIDDRIHILTADVRNEEQVIEQVGNLEFDVVVDFLSFNTKELERMLKIFNKKCKQFIFISTATVYKDVEKGKRICEDDEVGSIWDYSIDKLKCEELLKQNEQENLQKYTIVRPYVTYSNKRIPFGIISKKRQWSLINRILNDKPVLIWDDGQAICTLTHSKDFAVGIVGLFLNPRAYGEIFHITSDYILTWEDAIKQMAKAVGKEAKIEKIPTNFIIKQIPELKGALLGDRIFDRKFDNHKIKEVVPEYEANIQFEEGIKQTIEYYKAHNHMQKIDYHWEAQIDSTIKKYEKSKKQRKFTKEELNISNNKEKISLEEKAIYIIFRYNYFISERDLSIFKKN